MVLFIPWPRGDALCQACRSYCCWQESPPRAERGAWVPRLSSDPQDVALSIPDRDLHCGSRELPDLWPGFSIVWFYVFPLFYFSGFSPTSSGISLQKGSGWNNVGLVPRYLVYTGYQFPGGDFQSVPDIRADLSSLPSWWFPDAGADVECPTEFSLLLPALALHAGVPGPFTEINIYFKN